MVHRPTVPFYSPQAKSLTVGEVYEHYSGKQYRVLAIARHSETLEEMVVYEALYGDQNVWTRPLDMFMESILLEGKLCARFKQVDLEMAHADDELF